MKRITIFWITMMVLILTFVGCSENGAHYEKKSYDKDAAEVTAVKIDVQGRNIEVSLSKDEKIHLEYFENDKEFYDITLSDDKVLTVALSTNKDWTDYIGKGTPRDAKKLLLQVPHDSLESLTLSTSNEDISLSALTVTGEVSLSSNGGNIIIDKLNAGKAIRLTGKNGNISGSVIGGYDDYSIICDIKKGESNLPKNKEGGKKTLEVSNNNGDINIELINK